MAEGFIANAPGFVPDAPGFIPDSPSGVQQLNKTSPQGRLFSRILGALSGGQAAVQDAQRRENTGLSQPLVNVSPRLLSPFVTGQMQDYGLRTSASSQRFKKGLTEGGAEALSGLTSPQNIGIGAAATLQPEIVAGVLGGMGAKEAGQHLGEASVQGDTEEGGQNLAAGLASIVQALAPVGLGMGKMSTKETPGFITDKQYEKANEPRAEVSVSPTEVRRLPAPDIGKPQPPVVAPTTPEEKVVGVDAPTVAAPKKPMFYREADDLLSGKGLGFNPTAKIEGQQIKNRLKNTLPPGEYEALSEAGLSEFLGEKRTPEEVGAWVKEKGPKVEVRTLEPKSGASLEELEHNRMRHEWYDNLDNNKKFILGEISRTTLNLPEEFTARLRAANWNESDIKKAERYRELGQVLSGRYVEHGDPGESATARYPMVNPKPLDKMPGAVDLLVRVPAPTKVPVGEYEPIGDKYKYPKGEIKYSSSHYPTEGKNLLAHVRGYMETTPDGKKVFHVFEVQSDWAQAVRSAQEKVNNLEYPGDYQNTVEAGYAPDKDPLLKHYERLALKAAIDHARKNGADAIALSDAETAMLTEGHDRTMRPMVHGPPYYNNEAAAQAGLLRLQPQYDFPLTVEHTPQGWHVKGEGEKRAISQEKGMRLHYDKTLPKIAEELTGEKGQPVDFGEHQNAFSDRTDSDHRMLTDEEFREARGPRSDLIFRDPDGTPKTSITARLYPLTKARDSFSLFGSDRPVVVKPTPKKESLLPATTKAEPPATTNGGAITGPPKPPKDVPPPGDADSSDGGRRIPKDVEPLLPEKMSDIVKEVSNALMKQTLPRTTAVSPALAEAMIKWGNSREHSAALGESYATDALGSQRYKDKVFDQKVGDVLVEGMLKADGKTSIGKEWSSLKTEDDYIKALSDPEVQRTIKIHKRTTQEMGEKHHTMLGGTLVEKDPVTGAFVNMKALFGDDTDVENAARTSRPTEPLQKGSRFSRERKGTGERYLNSFRELTKRMVAGNYDEAMKQNVFDVAEKEGVGRYLKRGQKAPGNSVVYTLKRKGVPHSEDGEITGAGTYVKRFALRKDIADEFEVNAQLTGENRRSFVKKLLGQATKLQTTLGVDAAVHGGQLIMAVNTAERASGAHAIAGIREADSLVRGARNFYKSILNDPRTQQEIAQFTEVSPGPDGSFRKGPIGWMLKHIDRGGRLALNEMYNEMVQKGTIKDSTLGREKFISQIGQYNKRLMSKLDLNAREYGFGPFVTAGRTGNARAIRAAMMQPTVEGANVKQAVKLRAQKILGALTTVGVTVPAINLALSGSVYGPTGTPLGAIGWEDKKGQLHTLDAAKWLQLRRPVTGLAAIERGVRGGKKPTEIAMDSAFDMAKGLLHPYVGPGLNALSLAMGGHDVLGYKESDRPEDHKSNLKAGALALNPTVEAALTKGKSSLDPYERAIGIANPKLSSADEAKRISERLFGKGTNVEQLKPADRMKLSQQLKQARKPDDVVQQRKRIEFGTRKGLEQVEDVQTALSKENQAFLEKHKLTLPEEYNRKSIESRYANTYTPREKDFLQSAMVKQYDKAIGRLSQQGDWNAITPTAKEARLKRVLRGAFTLAEVDLMKARKDGSLDKPMKRNDFSIKNRLNK